MNYTPTTDDLAHAIGEWAYKTGHPENQNRPELLADDGETMLARFLTAHDREVAARAVKTIAALHIRRGRPSMSECSCGEIICPTLREIERLVEPNA